MESGGKLKLDQVHGMILTTVLASSPPHRKQSRRNASCAYVTTEAEHGPAPRAPIRYDGWEGCVEEVAWRGERTSC